jgi:hypothetical protein
LPGGARCACGSFLKEGPVIKTLMAVAEEWGLNSSTLRKALEANPQRIPGTLNLHTWFMDDASPQFQTWLREYVLSRRVRGALAPLQEMARVAVTFRPWPVEGIGPEEVVRPLETLLRLSTSAPPAERTRQHIRAAFAQELGIPPDGEATVQYVEAFFRLVEGAVAPLPEGRQERSKLYLFAYQTYQQEAIEQGGFIRRLEGGSYALGPTELREGDDCAVEVDGHSIRGTLSRGPELGWYLVARDRTVILIHAGMRARPQVAQERAPA